MATKTIKAKKNTATKEATVIQPITVNHNEIFVKGARVHNLKNIDVIIPRNKLVVITGLSGSGKSSLAFDTLYAEGQRRYVESLSSYARQFMGRLNKPDVDYISGISPAVAIQQKVSTHNPRSTVGTSTEIYDYLKLLYARAGKTYHPTSGKEVACSTVADVINYLQQQPNESKVHIYIAIQKHATRTAVQQLQVFRQQGFSRMEYKSKLVKIDDVLDVITDKEIAKCLLLVDRFVLNTTDEDEQTRWGDSIQTSFFEGDGICIVEVDNDKGLTKKTFSNKFEADGMQFEQPSLNFFSFNNPVGACKRCEGFGSVLGIDPDLVIPNKNLSVFENAVSPWKGEVMSEYLKPLLLNANKFSFPIHRSYNELSKAEKELLWTGNKYFMGLTSFFEYLETQTYKIQYRVMLSRYRGKTSCPDCQGSRLRKDASYVKIADKSITDVVLMQVRNAYTHFNTLKLTGQQAQIADKLLVEIVSRLQFLMEVGLGYLTLNRLSNSLSGGESQRINLATNIGSSLVGSLYVLDEPSIGLHPRDTEQLIKVLEALRNLGNTVIVVEHDEEIMRASDYLIDIGPMAGRNGGQVVFQGHISKITDVSESLTTAYLTGAEKIELPARRRASNYFVELKGVTENNLKNIDVKFPLNNLCVVTGVSGSGKTSLVKRVLYPALKKLTGTYTELTGKHETMLGDYDKIRHVEFVDQNPIGRSSRSNPVTYLKAYDEIRNSYSAVPLAQQRGFKPSHFSFNVDGGRCEACEGDGNIHIPMQFMADVELLCEACEGKRFKAEVLEIEYMGKNIHELLTMTVDEALVFYTASAKLTTADKKIIAKLQCLADVGLGYVQLGQSSSTLSGGEAQRIKLAYFLSMGDFDNHTLFIFDEPTTGLHFHDIKKLLAAFDALLKQGNSIVLIEHNMEIIKCADYIIDIGPDGGDEGGQLVYQGQPEGLVNIKHSNTAKYLKAALNVK
jgi:excinuclease ABC subunit A